MSEQQPPDERWAGGSPGEGDPGAADDPGAPGDPRGEGAPRSDEQMQRELEEQLRRVRVQDLVLESVATIANLSMRRIAKEDERDLEQARLGIEAVRAMVGLLDDEPQAQVRQALTQLQVHYAQAAQAGEQAPPPDQAGAAAGEQEGGSADRPRPQQQPPGGSPPGGGSEPPPRLWVPPGSA